MGAVRRRHQRRRRRLTLDRHHLDEPNAVQRYARSRAVSWHLGVYPRSIAAGSMNKLRDGSTTARMLCTCKPVTSDDRPTSPLLRAIFDAAVAAAASRHRAAGASATRAERPGDLPCRRQGAAAMAAAAGGTISTRSALHPAQLTGIATTRHGHGVPTRRIRVVEASHPVPDEAGLKSARTTAATGARRPTADDLLLVLLSGGGSANWIAPAGWRRFAQKQQVDAARCCAPARSIGEINIVRKHLSRIKGGRLARAPASAPRS